MIFRRLALVALTFAVATPAAAADAERRPFGKLADGTAVEVVTLQNDNGVEARILSYGATLQALIGPDRAGQRADVTLGHDTLEPYEKTPNYFGVTVGRHANRINAGRFTLDGKAYQLTQNDKGNSLHGGTQGFDKRNWRIVSVASGPAARVVLSLTSPDGDQGYPGKLDVTVTYSLDEANNLTIAYEAKTDKPTIVNMTNHALFNLAGEGAPQGTSDHMLTIPAKAFTPVNAALIPTGERRAVANSVFDFTSPRLIASGVRDNTNEQILLGRGYDHNFALDKGVTARPELAARLVDPKSGRVLDVLTTEPGVQFYTGNFLDGSVTGKNGHAYRQGDGIALEPQKFPDAPNQPGFVSARVDPGKPYRHTMTYRLTTSR
ncbi:aldose epimerase family protein [Sphingomonas sp.]|uniref:aldose epimerase family protein n=1 Tax=Sphingomonas sp. TaxID=28214 RepID=UPI002C0EB1CC|nr:aldose epimerase family protein [Sphingomonas sp.]HTG38133.1 aldose epimerase family protein [Sphingomonas sp.]